MTAEVWKEVPQYPKYQISNLGNVRRYIAGRFRSLNPYLTNQGYYEVILTDKERKKRCRVHQLVATVFVENPNHKSQVDHIDGDKTNNRVENLRWVTLSENLHNPNTFANMRRRRKEVNRKKVIRNYNSMTVSTEDIRNIKPGSTEAFNCDSGKMYAVATALSTLKRRGLPEGVTDYEHKKLFDKNIIIIRALREGDEPVLNR